MNKVAEFLSDLLSLILVREGVYKRVRLLELKGFRRKLEIFLMTARPWMALGVMLSIMIVIFMKLNGASDPLSHLFFYSAFANVAPLALLFALLSAYATYFYAEKMDELRARAKERGEL